MPDEKMLEEFKDWLTNKEQLAEGSVKKYSNTIDMFTRKLGKHLQYIEVDDISRFLQNNKKPSTHDNKRYHIAKLLKFLKEEKNIINFTMDETSISNKKPKEKENVEHWSQISFGELMLIRETLKKHPFQHFLFELVYQHGLTLDELEMCFKKNYDSNIGGFSLETRKKPVYISKEIQLLIENHTNLLNKRKVSTIKKHFSNNISEYIKEAGINRKISWGDINISHKNYCFMCFNCDTKYENVSENWTVIKENDSGKNLLVCFNCAKDIEKGAAK